MDEVFYAVQCIMNGHCGTQATRCATLDDVREYIEKLKKFSETNAPSVDVAFHVYEVKEIEY